MQMQTLYVGIITFILGIVLELFIYVSSFGWRNKQYFATASLILSAFSVGIFAAAALSPATILALLLMVYRATNLLRLVENRMHQEYLRRASRTSSLWLIGYQLTALFLWVLFAIIPSSFSGTTVLHFIAGSYMLAGLFVVVSSAKTIWTTRVTRIKSLSDNELPTLTVAIAARNENTILQECLSALLKSDYPKLEIIVLDDCSQDHTAEVIKSFAHDGVRFVQGNEPNSTWLAKNAAYQKLLEEATGTIIMFMGVDVQVKTQTLRTLVNVFIDKQVTMLSVLPKRTHSGLLAAFIQPMRYWLELALPEWIIRHAPVLSTSWMADRKALLANGGFKSVTRAIVPEEHLSTTFSKQNQYAFIRTNDDIHLTTHKNFKSQWLTALRTRYPQAHRRPEYVAIRVIAMLYFLISPFIVLPMLLIAGNIAWQVIIMTAIGVVCLIASHLIVALLTNPAAAWVAPLNFPIVVTIDFIAMHISMYRYEFGEVVWKGRNVITPAMHVVPHLPKI